LPILAVSNETARCNKKSSCSAPLICSRPDEQEQILRLTIKYSVDKQDIILWSGPLEEIQKTVMLGRLKPRLSILPLSLPLLLSRYLRYLSLATVSLYLFNLLPIRLLDGHHILEIVLDAGASEQSGSSEYDMESATTTNRRRLTWTCRTARLLSVWLSNITLGMLVLSLILTVLSL
jgi:S2P endopeptidase